MLVIDGKNNKQETAGGNWRNSALLTKDREKIQTSEKTERESESEDWSTVCRHNQREREREKCEQ